MSKWMFLKKKWLSYKTKLMQPSMVQTIKRTTRQEKKEKSKELKSNPSPCCRIYSKTLKTSSIFKCKILLLNMVFKDLKKFQRVSILKVIQSNSNQRKKMHTSMNTIEMTLVPMRSVLIEDNWRAKRRSSSKRSLKSLGVVRRILMWWSATGVFSSSNSNNC